MTIKYLPAYQGFTYLNLRANHNHLALDITVDNTAKVCLFWRDLLVEAGWAGQT
jgi:hypothetical protein